MNELYADIIVDISVQALDRPFSYHIPDVLRDSVGVGSLVTIPFGPRMVRGYVIRLKDSCDYDPDKIKDIAAVLTDEETVEARLIDRPRGLDVPDLRRSHGSVTSHCSASREKSESAHDPKSHHN